MDQPAQTPKRTMSTVWDAEEEERNADDARFHDPANPCLRAVNLLRLLKGTLVESERPRVEAHLATCSRCRAALRGFQNGEVGEPIPQPVPGSVLEELMQDFQSYKTTRMRGDGTVSSQGKAPH